MPANLVQNPEDERHWAAAKKRAKEQGHEGDWKYVVGIFEQMSKAEGDRGGHVIGHTASGQPIYERHNDPTVLEYAKQNLINGKSKTIAHAAKATAAKLHGGENMMIGPGVSHIDAKKLEHALTHELWEHASPTPYKQPDKPREHMANSTGTKWTFKLGDKDMAKLEAYKPEAIEKSAFVIPGQVPRMSSPTNILTDMPKPVDMAAKRLEFTEPVLQPEGITKGLNLENTKALAFQRFVKGIQDSDNELVFRQQLFRHMHYDHKDLDPMQRQALAQRALSFYKSRGKSPNEARVQTRVQGFKMQKSETFTLLEKAEARGGSYHRRVTDKETGKHRYFYSEEDYQKRGDAHLSGAEVKKANCRKAVLGHVGDKGCHIEDLKALSGKYADQDIADAVRDHVSSGKLQHKDGRLMPIMAKASGITPVGHMARPHHPPINPTPGAKPIVSPAMAKQKNKARKEALKNAGIKTPMQEQHEAERAAETKDMAKGDMKEWLMKSDEATAQSLAQLLANLRACSELAQSFHWRTAGANFQGDHALFARVYETLSGMIDPLAEKLIGVTGNADILAAPRQMQATAALLAGREEPANEEAFPGAMLSCTNTLLGEVGDRLQNLDGMSPGLENHLQGIADAIEGLAYLLQQRTSGMQKSGANMDPNKMDLCKCGYAMKKSDGVKCPKCGCMAKAESTGISSDFGGNPESTDVRVVRELESDEDEGDEIEKGVEEGGAPSPEEEDPSDGASGDPEGKNVNTSDGAATGAADKMLSKGLHGWLSKAFGDAPEKMDEADKRDAAEEAKDAAEDADEPDEKDSGSDDMEKSKYTKRTGGPGNYKYEYADEAGGSSPKSATTSPDAYSLSNKASDAAAHAFGASSRQSMSTADKIKAHETAIQAHKDAESAHRTQPSAFSKEKIADHREQQRALRRSMEKLAQGAGPAAAGENSASIHKEGMANDKKLVADAVAHKQGKADAANDRSKAAFEATSAAHGHPGNYRYEYADEKGGPPKSSGGGINLDEHGMPALGKEAHADVAARANRQTENAEAASSRANAAPRIEPGSGISAQGQKKLDHQRAAEFHAEAAKTHGAAMSSAPGRDAAEKHRKQIEVHIAKRDEHIKAAGMANDKAKEGSPSHPAASDAFAQGNKQSSQNPDATSHHESYSAASSAGYAFAAKPENEGKVHHATYTKPSGEKGLVATRRAAGDSIRQSHEKLHKSGAMNMEDLKKSGLAGWLMQKGNIPDASDTSEGKGPYDDLPSGEPSMEPGESVNGPMLSLGGMGANAGGPGSGSQAPALLSDTGKNEQLSEDDPDQAGEMKSGEPGMKAKPPEMPASAINAMDAGPDVIKGMTLAPSREEAVYAAKTNATRFQKSLEKDVTVGVGRAAPRVKADPAPTVATFQKGFAQYSDASDLAVEKAMKGDGFYQNGSPTLGTQGTLIKSMGCPACASNMPAWASRCPECGHNLGSNLSKAIVNNQPVVRAPGIRPRVTADLHLPGGVKRK